MIYLWLTLQIFLCLTRMPRRLLYYFFMAGKMCRDKLSGHFVFAQLTYFRTLSFYSSAHMLIADTLLRMHNLHRLFRLWYSGSRTEIDEVCANVLRLSNYTVGCATADYHYSQVPLPQHFCLRSVSICTLFLPFQLWTCPANKKSTSTIYENAFTYTYKYTQKYTNAYDKQIYICTHKYTKRVVYITQIQSH